MNNKIILFLMIGMISFSFVFVIAQIENKEVSTGNTQGVVDVNKEKNINR